MGDKWTLLILRDALFEGKHEFNEFLSSPEAISTNILADRLKRLVDNRIFGKIRHPINRNKRLYYLLPRGKSLLPVFLEMMHWSQSADERTLAARSEIFGKSVLAALEKWENEFLNQEGARG
ncbi:MAG: helix-turn-helix transcriptional regulator [Cyanobacteria bacterium SZAS TMP-1]|nr:helix-turn-helix transcriptional regulator [Cyanobacteria bacterium SZAS TMP-1]